MRTYEKGTLFVTEDGDIYTYSRGGNDLHYFYLHDTNKRPRESFRVYEYYGKEKELNEHIIVLPGMPLDLRGNGKDYVGLQIFDEMDVGQIL